MDLYALSDDELLREIGRRVQQRRLAKNLTQLAVAQAAGLNRTTVASLEGGNSPHLSTLLQVLRVLGGLEDLDRFLPEPGPSPLQLIKLKGRERRRASRSAPQDPDEGSEW